MKQNSILSWIGIGAILYFAAKALGAGVSQKLRLGNPGLKIMGSTALELRAQLSLPFENLTPVSIPLDGFDGALVYGSYALASIHLPSSLTLQAHQTVEIPIDLQIVYANLATQLTELIGNSDYLNQLRVIGQIHSSGIIIPVNQKIKVL